MKIYKIKEICRLEKGKQIDTTLLSACNPYKYINGGIKESGYYTSYNTDGEAVLVSEGGVSCGYVNYINEKFWCGCHCYKLTECKFLTKYIYYALKGNQDKLMALRTGAAMPNIKKSTFQDMELKLNDDFTQQKKVINELDKIQIAIATKQTELIALDDLVKSRFIEMFASQKFPIISLDSIAEVTGGLTKNSKRKDMPMKYPYLRVANVYYNHLDLSEILEIGVKDNVEVEKTLLKTDDLLFVEGNGSPEQIGRVALWNGAIEHCLHQNHLIKARLDLSKVNPRYVLFYFMSEDGREQIANRAVSTSGLYTLSVSKVAGLTLPIPPIELQNEFAEFVKQTDKSKFVCHFNPSIFCANFSHFRHPP